MIDPQMVVPMVVETTGRGERAFDIYSLLLKNRIILLSNPINDQVANIVVAQLIYLSNEDPEAPIFSIADLGIVADGDQILTALLAAIENR